MYVDEIMALVRLSEQDDVIVSDLARTILALVEQLRDASLRADLAEATLEVELRRKGELKRKLARLEAGDLATMSRVLLEVAEVVTR